MSSAGIDKRGMAVRAGSRRPNRALPLRRTVTHIHRMGRGMLVAGLLTPPAPPTEGLPQRFGMGAYVHRMARGGES
jgi:hypothetical protein